MRTRQSFFPLIIVLLAGVVSCNDGLFDHGQTGNNQNSFYASIDNGSVYGPYMDSGISIFWDTDDRVSVFDRGTINEEYRYTGATGTVAGWMGPVRKDDTGKNKAMNLIYSLYPYRESNSIDSNGTISVVLPSEQTYRQNSFGLEANTMMAVSRGRRLFFRDASGYLVINLYGKDIKVSSVTLRGNAGEPLAGEAKISMGNGGIPSMSFERRASTEVTLVCTDPVELSHGVSKAVPFWFAIPPTDFTKGFTVIVKGSDNEVFSLTTEKAVKVSRNQKRVMSPFCLEDSESWGNITVDMNKYCSLTGVFGSDLDGNQKWVFHDKDDVRVRVTSWRCRCDSPGHIGYHVSNVKLDLPGVAIMDIPLERNEGDNYVSGNKSVSGARLNKYEISSDGKYLVFDISITLYRETNGDIRIFYAGPVD